MNYKKIVRSIFLLLVLTSVRGQAQTIEQNKVNNWIYPDAQKYIGMDFINTSTGVFINNGAVWYSHNFTNNGKVDFVTNLATSPALSQFSGSNTQHISGSGSTRFYGLFLGSDLVDNAFSLEQNISVANSVNFVKGIVVASQPSSETMTNMLLLENGAGWINASDMSHVDGFVSKAGNSSFVFPIGDGGYFRPASISAPASVTDCFAARYIFGDPDKAGFLRTQRDNQAIHISSKEYWILNRTSGSADVQLTLSWDVTKTSASMPSELNKIRIVRWDGSKWITENSVSTTGNFTTGTITANVTGYGAFTLATYSVVSVAINDSVANWEDEPVSGNVLANDSVFNGNKLTLTGFSVGGVIGQPGSTITLPDVGSITMAANGDYTFTPALNYFGTVPVISYTAIDTDKNLAGANLIIVVHPLPEISKTSSKPVFNHDGSYSWKYTISLYNDTQTKIDSIQVEDNLDDVFKDKNCTYSVTSLLASGKLTANGSYNGSTILKMLLPGASLDVNARDSIKMEVKVFPSDLQTDTLLLSNQAFFSGQTLVNSKEPIYFKDIRTDENSTTSVAEPTITAMPVATLFIPDGFSPNGDGINDKFIITHTASTKIDLEVYNRWGILVYKSSDYQNDWDGTGMGTFLGKELISGTYYCVYKQIKIATGEVVNRNVKYISLRRP
ncbi:hypothetical protein Palpr_1085 [Paludibacter propionicigenes WB4]|uniref:DUF11 domain-containing protein n=1 Tax=Paludibacter propionicigenes (strain DSM 17365 / JCM 13257 / WB4) TaxID=694427 RepID=E4T3E0_PALPW|nr:gliding motility-associated C-terminal domain-containing protein [Paludibacter propionicigenes]ADQ79234.1 hypothetical protein Palpr_1085 [Paludibacter propionicigenes WB4]